MPRKHNMTAASREKMARLMRERMAVKNPMHDAETARKSGETRSRLMAAGRAALEAAEAKKDEQA